MHCTMVPSGPPSLPGVEEEGRWPPILCQLSGAQQITVKNCHPLPLTNTALDALSSASFNLIRTREGGE